MTFVMLGAGNVATHLSLALQSAGHTPLQVMSRTMASAQWLASALGCDFTTDTQTVRTDADIYLFAVNDEAIEQIARGIKADKADAVFVHTAGSVSADVFRGVAAYYGVLYPLQTFTKDADICFSEVPCFVEGNDEYAESVITLLARSISERVHRAGSHQRKCLHLAAVFACNFANHCYSLAADEMEQAALPFELLLPLIDETARKVRSLSPTSAQTGPAARGDKAIQELHLQMLADDELKSEVYKAMSRSIAHKKNKQ